MEERGYCSGNSLRVCLSLCACACVDEGLYFSVSGVSVCRVSTVCVFVDYCVKSDSLETRVVIAKHPYLCVCSVCVCVCIQWVCLGDVGLQGLDLAPASGVSL